MSTRKYRYEPPWGLCAGGGGGGGGGPFERAIAGIGGWGASYGWLSSGISNGSIGGNQGYGYSLADITNYAWNHSGDGITMFNNLGNGNWQQLNGGQLAGMNSMGMTIGYYYGINSDGTSRTIGGVSGQFEFVPFGPAGGVTAAAIVKHIDQDNFSKGGYYIGVEGEASAGIYYSNNTVTVGYNNHILGDFSLSNRNGFQSYNGMGLSASKTKILDLGGSLDWHTGAQLKVYQDGDKTWSVFSLNIVGVGAELSIDDHGNIFSGYLGGYLSGNFGGGVGASGTLKWSGYAW